MPPFVAFLTWLLLLLALLYFDPDRDRGVSATLWVPIIWLFIIGSRLPAQWLNGQVDNTAASFTKGNPINSSIFTFLIVLSIGILVYRSFNWGAFTTRNAALVVFLLFALVSVFWSDFPFIALKRWIRDLGNYLVILVALSDPHPLEAIRTVLRRLCYLLISLSILLIKYYPYLGKRYSLWTGAATYVGVTTSKNMLGAVCLIGGLFFFWDTARCWIDRTQKKRKRVICVNVAFLAMTLWLLHLAHSATSSVCLVIGCIVIAMAHIRPFRRHPAFLMLLCPASFLLYLTLVFGFGLMGNMARAVGRNANLTDRTQIWSALLSMHTNPLVGTGYQSFWLGSRLAQAWRRIGIDVNEAHNGYLGIYLELGDIGLLLIVGFLIACYRTIGRRLRSMTSIASLILAVWTILLFYNVTESAFAGGLLWDTLLLGAIALPGLGDDRVHAVVPTGTAVATAPFHGLPRRRPVLGDDISLGRATHEHKPEHPFSPRAFITKGKARHL